MNRGKLFFRRISLHLKGLGLYAAIPPFVLFLLIPGIIYLGYLQKLDDFLLYLGVIQYTQYLIPFFSVWWVLFVLREYLEPDGNELLFVNRRNKLWDLSAIFLLYLLCAGLLYIGLSVFFPLMHLEFLRILCVCVFYFGLVYFLAFLTKNITLPMMVTLLYTLFCLSSGWMGSEDPVFCYIQVVILAPETLLVLYLPRLLLGILLTAGGVILNRRMTKFR